MSVVPAAGRGQLSAASLAAGGIYHLSRNPRLGRQLFNVGRAAGREAQRLFNSYGVRPDEPSTSSSTMATPPKRTRAQMEEGDPNIEAEAIEDAPGIQQGVSDIATIPPAVTPHIPQVPITFRHVHHFCLPSNQSALAHTIIDPFPNVGWKAIASPNNYLCLPWKANTFWGSLREWNNLMSNCAEFSIKAGHVKLANFSVHSTVAQGTGSPHFQASLGGISFASVVSSSNEIGSYFVTQKVDGTTDMRYDEVNQFMHTKVPGFKNWEGFACQLAMTCTNGTNKTNNTVETDLFDWDKVAVHHNNSPAITQQSWSFPKRNRFPGFGATTLDEKRLGNTIPFYTYANQDPQQVYTTTVNGSFFQYRNVGGHNNTISVPQDTLPRGNGGALSSWFNICPQNGTPQSWFSNAFVDQTISYKQFNAIGDATPHRMDDIFAFKPMYPPMPDMSVPETMICFSLETELEMEYSPIASFAQWQAAQTRFNYHLDDGSVTAPDIALDEGYINHPNGNNLPIHPTIVDNAAHSFVAPCGNDIMGGFNADANSNFVVNNH